MDKMWAGRFAKTLDKTADDFNSSLKFDCKMFAQDIKGSMAHATMLAKCNVLAQDDVDKIIDGLESILADIESGKLKFDNGAEDIHMFVEGELTKRIGDLGKKLHTSRSRNDQVALDLRMYVKDELAKIKQLLVTLIDVISEKAEQNLDAIMPGYTHLQRAQPVTFAQHLMAYAMMFIRDVMRIDDTVKHMNLSPLGSCALAGTTYPIDRSITASLLGFDGYTQNSMDGVSDRDFCVETLSTLSLIMVHLSRFSEEIILWTSWEFKFMELDDSFTTGSSIMPQKKNSDMAELVRGKSGRVFGDLMGMLTVLKGLPLAYNKDMQEDKEGVFDALETVNMCLTVFTPMLATATVLKDNMLTASKKGFINATDMADYLTKKGMPFRTAYKITGTIVGDCIAKGKVLEDLTVEQYKQYSELFEEDIYKAISLVECVSKRTSQGGTAPSETQKQIAYAKDFIKAN
ncbi:MAG: argininosuccinate lyase [Clostridiales bacterium]|nr:argininosuccinate lyase [Clostridiales bacterium]